MEKLEQLLIKLDLKEENGLFFLKKYDQWLHLFPYRVSRVLKEILKPDAFYCLLKNPKLKNSEEHPEPVNQQFILFYENIDEDIEWELHKKILNFGLAQAVFIIRENVIDVFYGGIEKILEGRTLKKVKSGTVEDFEEFSFLNQLTGKTWAKHKFKGEKVDRFLLQNITDARRILVAKDGYNLNSKIANRLIGRLLFINYLIDRNVQFSDQDLIIGDSKEDRRNNFHNIISDQKKLYKFFKYLSKKYNGDLFPLIDEKDTSKSKIIDIEIKEETLVSNSHLSVLHHLFTCSSFFKSGGTEKGYTVQPSLFYLYDFEIIPVELISNIYENFIGNKEENENLKLKEVNKQRELKAYYTPSYLVDLILSLTVEKHLKQSSTSSCKVLDPACGSGIFLVESLRKIIEKEILIKRTKTLKAELDDQTLWKIIKNNIFGIDIDEEAIDIAIFSIYITLLDYKKNPKEIENFRFEKLKGTNFFGGVEADFFNVDHDFNKILRDKKLDFIVGNPPWGEVKKSIYIDYILKRKVLESGIQAVSKTIDHSKRGKISLEIGDKEIAQAFLVRVSDFCHADYLTKNALIVSSKVFYNRQETSRKFRRYFLNYFKIKTVIELALVNNKIVGDKHIFDHARQPASVIIYEWANNFPTWDNMVKHISIKPNRFFLQTKTIVIEKNDIKLTKQRYFIEEAGGFDWLWKVLVHGNVLDVFFIKKLREEFPTLQKIFKAAGITEKGGLKVKDGDKQIPTKEYSNTPYLVAKGGFAPYNISTDYLWKNEVRNLYKAGKIDQEGHVGYFPDPKYFNGYKLLVKKGIDLPYFGGVAAISKETILFSSTVCSFLPDKDTPKTRQILKNACGIINSNLFSYFILHTSSSAGIERSRVHFEEILSIPFVDNKEIASLVSELTKNYNIDLIHQINSIISNSFTKQEIALMNYASKIALPILFREQSIAMFKPFSTDNKKDCEYLKRYTDVFIEGFKNKFNKSKHLCAKVSVTNFFIKAEFYISEKNQKEIQFHKAENFSEIDFSGNLGFYEICRNILLQQDIRGYFKNSFYIIKPNDKKCWHEAMAYGDLNEVNTEFMKAELKVFKV